MAVDLGEKGSNGEKYLSVIKESINRLICTPEDRKCYAVFMDGYNAVYKYCTENTKEKYIIEGAEVYKIYDQLLIKHLKRLPEDYTLETFVRFIDGYIRANERICKMLSFLQRYFVRVNLEISNANVVELKDLYYQRLFSILINGKESKLHMMFVDELKEYLEIKLQKKVDVGAYNKKLKILRVMVRVYIKICEVSDQKKSLKKLFNAIAKFIAILKKKVSEKEQIDYIYYKIATVDGLFKNKEKSKKNLYRMVEEKLDDQILKNFIEGFVSKIMRTGINKKSHAEVVPFYSFIDSSVKSKSIFVNTAILMSIKIVEKITDCSSFLKFCIFMNKHFECMPRTSGSVKKVFELVLRRKLESLLITNTDTLEFEKQLLGDIETHMKQRKQPLLELSLIISNVPAHRNMFWSEFIIGIKNRLIMGSLAATEKKLINLITKRIEAYRESKLRKNLKVHKTALEYINIETLHKTQEYYDPVNFEEILLCIKDIAISEIYFRTHKSDLKSDCFLLACIRWNYPVVNIRIPAELKEMWSNLNKYCTEKGRKFILKLCPTVSSVTLEVNDIEVECDVIQGTILILLARAGIETLDSLVYAVLVDVTDQAQEMIKTKLQTLIDASIITENNGIYEIHKNLPKEPRRINIFSPDTQSTLSEITTAKYAYSKSAIEACIVRTLKKQTGMESSELKQIVMKTFPLEDQELDAYIMALQEKGLISASSNLLYFVP
ncbi:uncharacterized protein NEPG_00852 [Nematocida parisii ERTm1]|uniref:uncharacterized protein n=1 Tax=Nematocida parisii (strain ERTm1 / ATCC PRA-289) TaxID=881290 RepID=UPI000264B8C5|nr:uncharacterized protein NEPG_00852 [Nematocida parisii ERTm1]KAI5128641.1 hypothetical protein NEPAR08_1352 [Nematocida parisii]EIJ94185.1 hypothetical protein NEPG_00852 [Nematocida parisii ERTm1]KAI5128935.1 hypothetical protein NEPAR03_1426 [Nematocida parisii]KAI5141511.1 hypothetical protein NEPAR04_1012 [Nematocida parisii]KAI5144847.1 hypothetical protein NEPAR07_1305 [Nematocida parisii]|eukprot:XP_013058681.1 hypothetical protein NEPG_00852 [Nematocida parisii ERTm1]